MNRRSLLSKRRYPELRLWAESPEYRNNFNLRDLAASRLLTPCLGI